MQRPLGAQISHMLKDRGVDVVFGIPGVHNQEMYRGITEAGLTHVLARHEQGAGFMADGYARATGKSGVAYVITGPGLCNIMTPMGQAYSDSVPLLVLSSCLDETDAVRGQLHQMKDQTGAAATVCDWSREARTAPATFALVDRALTEFATRRKRPKHLSVPIFALQTAVPQGWDSDAGPVEDMTQTAATPVCQAFMDRLAAARRPLFVFGGGAVAGTDAIRTFLHGRGIASFSTAAGRGIVTDDPRAFGTMLARPDSAEVFARADLVVAVGTDLSEVDLWRDHPGHDCRMVIVNTDPEVLARRRARDMAIAADAGAFFAQVQALDRPSGPTGWTPMEVARAKGRWRSQIASERPGILPVIDALRAALPDDAIVYSDMTQFAYAALDVWSAPAPGLWHHPSGFGTLGYALPAAIGGKIGRPDAPVVAVAGDYGFQYTLQELAVAVELDLCLPIILWDNGKLGEIEDSMVAAQIAPNSVVQRNPAFVKLAEAYGAATAAPSSLAALSAAVAQALAAPGPTLIHVRADIAGAPDSD